MVRHRKRFSVQPIAEDIAVGALEHAADRKTQIDHSRRNFLVQPLLVIHRRQQADRHHDEGMILRRPDRHRETIDMRAPQAARDHITVFCEETPPNSFFVMKNEKTPLFKWVADRLYRTGKRDRIVARVTVDG